MRSLSTFSALLSLIACNFGCEEEAPPATDTPIVGVLELPISLRNTEQAPENPVRIEASPTALRFDGTKLMDLNRGVMADGERAGNLITKLRAAIRSAPARSSATLRLHVNLAYETTALILSTLNDANIRRIAFEVRPPGGTTTTGWLVLSHYRVVEATSDPVPWEDPIQRGWDEFVAVWQEAYEGCRRDHYVDCSPKPMNTREGGGVQITFFSRGSAVKAEFTRIPPEGEEAGPEMVELLPGVPAVAQAEGEEPQYPEMNDGSFTWRFAAATDELSPIRAAFRPLCGARPCGVVQRGDVTTMTMRVISTLGAAFPDGAPAPHVAFMLPAQP